MEGFGEDTIDMLTERVYPAYWQALMTADDGWPDDDEDVPKEEWDAAFKMLDEALITERRRQWGAKQPKLSSDPEAARLQADRDIPKTLAERLVKEHRRRKFIEMPPSSNKPQ